jgi:uncharacterized membrane protein YcaP (DUF421 family)
VNDAIIQGAKAGIIMLVLLIGYRLLGKRQLAQMNLYDLAMVMAVSNAVQNAITAGKGSLVVGLTTSTVVVLVAWLATQLFIRVPRLEERCIGTPTVLVSEGRVMTSRMRRERILPQELLEALRSHGLEHASQAKLVVLEVDGTISVVPKA